MHEEYWLTHKDCWDDMIDQLPKESIKHIYEYPHSVEGRTFQEQVKQEVKKRLNRD